MDDDQSLEGEYLPADERHDEGADTAAEVLERMFG